MKSSWSLFIAAAILILTSMDTYAQIYKWVDADGEVHYSQTKPESSDSAQMLDAPQVKSSTVGGNSSIAAKCGSQDSVDDNGTTYCCTSSCAKEKQAKGESFTCATQECFDGMIEIGAENDKKQAELKAKQEAEKKASEGSAAQSPYAQQRKFKEEQDKKVIEDCIAQRNTYCDKGADAIRDIQSDPTRQSIYNTTGN